MDIEPMRFRVQFTGQNFTRSDSFYFATISAQHGYQLHPTYVTLLVQVQVLREPACSCVLRPLQTVLLCRVALVTPDWISQYYMTSI